MARKKQLKLDSCKALFPGIENIKELCDKHKALIHASNILKKAERLQRPWAEIEKKLTTFGTII